MRGWKPLRPPMRGALPLCTPHERALRPAAPGDFLMRRKSPKTHQEPPGPWTSGEGGVAPFDPPALCPSGIGGGGTGSAASSGGGAAERAADSLSLIQEKIAGCQVGSAGRCGRRGHSRLSDRDKIWGRRGKHLSLLYTTIYYLYYILYIFCSHKGILILNKWLNKAVCLIRNNSFR